MLRYVFLLFVFLLKAVNIRADCQSPTLPGNMILAGDSSKQKTFLNGSTVKLTCLPGYKTGSLRKPIKCLGDQWTDPEFECKKKSCGALAEIYNGRYVINEGIEFGATVTAECNPGYQLFGQDTRFCRDAGWSGRDPVCEAVKCTKLPEIENGTPEEPYYEVYEHGQSVTYKCKRDYDMVGTATITCSDDGLFQPSPPQCLSIEGYGYRTTTPAPITTIMTTVEVLSSTLVTCYSGWENQSVHVNQTWIESFFLRSWSGVPLWYDVVRWVFFTAMVITTGLVHMRTRARPSRHKALHRLQKHI